MDSHFLKFDHGLNPSLMVHLCLQLYSNVFTPHFLASDCFNI